MIGAIWLLACSGGDSGPGAGGLLAEDFAGPSEFRMEFIEAGSMTSNDSGEDTAVATDVLHLHASDGTWSFRHGQRWSEATQMGEYAVEVTDDGITLAGDPVLPPRVAVGETTSGVEVTALGELEVWYGTFPMVASVTVSEGVPGEHAFAQGIGPVQLELFDASWELAFYE
ncbi:MAG: hypothetical protein GY913_30070 [Proteobacteria bacterium]|nr:hypothetical protein [Pseudomonadota bacterium]MCP4921164.1 hypothetical protein [Pseudomonadota bacterium]